FVKPLQIQGDTVIVTEDAHHIKDVLRMQAGDTIEVCDGQGMDYTVRLETLSSERVTGRIEEQGPSTSEPAIHVTLFQGLPKSDKMEWILQKGTELGISSFVPVTMQRSVVRYDAKKDAKKTERFRKIAEAAAKQSGRGRIPEVQEVRSFQSVIGEVGKYDLFLVPYEAGLEHSLKRTLSSVPAMPKTVAILIGPEGGIDPKEVDALTEAGAQVVGLGPRILRTETAGMAAVTMLLYHFDQMEL
ncbi:MAG: 16S rRNA (uracil(1498)-N(3))-methyltransferase, partial [Clostridia bacterium]|nr:16S rRNA (uracil(1498)-N(3))-methyltransferase [Clostridia bacterium]